jgi:hypothetical protein
LRTIEESALSTWVRDSPTVFGFWFILSFHAIGMALLVGASTVIALRLLGVAREVPLSALRRLYPLIWTGFWIQVVSGVLLLIGYPTKSLTTPTFYIKLAMIAVGMVVMVKIKKGLPSEPSDPAVFVRGKPLAVWSLMLWFGAITAGRFIAYTAKYITYPSGL